MGTGEGGTGVGVGEGLSAIEKSPFFNKHFESGIEFGEMTFLPVLLKVGKFHRTDTLCGPGMTCEVRMV